MQNDKLEALHNHLSLQEQQRGKRGGLGQENVFNILGIGSQVLDLKPDPKQPLIRFVKQGTKPKVKRLNTKKTFEEPEIIKERKSIKRKRESKQINGNTSKKVKKKKSISNGHITSSVEISKTIVSSKSSITEISSIKNIISMNVRIKKLKLKDERKLKKITLLHFHSDTFFYRTDDNLCSTFMVKDVEKVKISKSSGEIYSFR
eukprot:snap_masked-scaffold_4-processed-gene-4.15-mRNA-1 protein AED:1.00 eAED:1.00 QI:0/-1/0/0/-1/1/1/0/203